MGAISDIPSGTWVTLAVLLGYASASGLDSGDQNSLGNFFSLVGAILTAAAGQSVPAQNTPGSHAALPAAQEARLARIEAALREGGLL